MQFLSIFILLHNYFLLQFGTLLVVCEGGPESGTQGTVHISGTVAGLKDINVLDELYEMGTTLVVSVREMKGMCDTCLLSALLNSLFFRSPVLVPALCNISSKLSSSCGFSCIFLFLLTILDALTALALNHNIFTSKARRQFSCRHEGIEAVVPP